MLENKSFIASRGALYCLSIILTVCVIPIAHGSQEPEYLKIDRIWPKHRKPPAEVNPNRPTTHDGNATYKPLKAPRRATVMSSAEIGLTLWRYVPSVKEDIETTKGIVWDPGSGNYWTPVRWGIDEDFNLNDRFKFSIEALRPGFLYVIDAVSYHDGSQTYSLLFPNSDTSVGSNQINPEGGMLMIPHPESKAKRFRIVLSKSAKGSPQVKEDFLIVITPNPLALKWSDPEKMELDQHMVREWLNKWERDCQILVRTANPNLRERMTLEEAAVARDPEKFLTTADPYPQTRIRVAASENEPWLVRLPLQIAALSRPRRVADTR